MNHETRLIRVGIIATVVCASNLAAGETLIFDDQADFETYALSQGGVMTALETFEEHNLSGLTFLDDPLAWNVTNVDPNTGRGFPDGLTTQNLLVQSNMGPNPGAPTENPRGTGALHVVVAPFRPRRPVTGAAVWVDSTDLIFTDPSQTGVGFWFSSVGFQPWPSTTSLEFTVFDQSGVRIAGAIVEDVVVTDGGFFGVWSDAAIGRINVYDLEYQGARFGAEAVSDIQMWAREPVNLRAGDADQDLDFDQLDLVQVQVAAKYLTGQPATWGEGDWNGAPGGSPGSPPLGDGMFDQLDIIAAQQDALYLTGPYAAIQPNGQSGDGQTSVVYNPASGELSVDAPAGMELTSINIDSTAGIFTGQAAQNVGGSFDNDADGNIFKATFGSSFGSLSFGNVAQAGLAEEFVLNDLTVIGSLAGGGDLGDVDLIYVPEPSSLILLCMATVLLAGRWLGLIRIGNYHVRPFYV